MTGKATSVWARYVGPDTDQHTRSFGGKMAVRHGSTTSGSSSTAVGGRLNRLLEQEVEVLRRAAAQISQAHLPGNDVPARP